MHPISFFYDRIGQTIYRGKTPVKVTIENYEKLYNLQDKAYTFTAPLRVTVSESTCVSCEG